MEAGSLDSSLKLAQKEAALEAWTSLASPGRDASGSCASKKLESESEDWYSSMFSEELGLLEESTHKQHMLDELVPSRETAQPAPSDSAGDSFEEEDSDEDFYDPDT
jgi:hypothetical protein